MLTLTLLSLVLILLLCIHVVYVAFYWKIRKVQYSLKATIKGSLDLFLMKSSLGMFCEELYNSTPENYVGFHVLGRPGILVKDPELIKRVLVKDFHYFPDRTMASVHDADPIGNRILFVEKSPVWKFIRLKISPAFSSGRMRAMYPKMVEIGDYLVEYLSEHNGKNVEIKETCARYSTGVVTNSAFGVKENCFTNDKALSREASRKIFIFNFKRGIQFNFYFIAPFLASLFRMKWLDPSSAEFVKTMYSDIKEKRESQVNDEFINDFVGFLYNLDDKGTFKDPLECYAQAAQFFLAGFETVGSTLTFALYELAYNQDIQDKLRDEIKSVIANYDGQLTYEGLLQMEYLTMVLNETTRKYPVVPFLDRRAANDYKIPNTDITIDKGTNVYISVQGLQYDPKHFPEPLKFDPERFSSENRHNINLNTFLPFGDGPRNCIGGRFGKLSVLVGLARIIENFKIAGVNKNFEQLAFNPKGFLLSPQSTIHLKFNKV